MPGLSPEVNMRSDSTFEVTDWVRTHPVRLLLLALLWLSLLPPPPPVAAAAASWA